MASKLSQSVTKLQELCTTYETLRLNLTQKIKDKGVNVPNGVMLKELVNKYIPKIVVGKPMRQWSVKLTNVPYGASNFKVFNYRYIYGHRNTDYKGDTNCGEYFTSTFTRSGTTVTIPINFYDLGLSMDDPKDVFYVMQTTQSQCYIDDKVRYVEGKGAKCPLDYLMFSGGEPVIYGGWEYDYSSLEDMKL